LPDGYGVTQIAVSEPSWFAGYSGRIVYSSDHGDHADDLIVTAKSADDSDAPGHPYGVDCEITVNGRPGTYARTDDEIVITQAKGPPEKFDPVVKRLDIQDRTVGETPVKFDHNVTRRVWSENPDEPHVKSHRSEGRVFQLLYRDPAGRHFVQPEDDDIDETDADEYVPTDHPGLTVNATYMRTEEDEDTRYTTEREYRITPELLDAYAAVYALSYHEVNEESYGQAIWEVEDGVAYRLRRATE